MPNIANDEPNFPIVAIAPLPIDDIRRLGRKWVAGALILQSLVLTTCVSAFLCDEIVWLIYPIFAAAFAVWVLLIPIAPMIVLLACVFVDEPPRRTAVCTMASIFLTGLPVLVPALLVRR